MQLYAVALDASPLQQLVDSKVIQLGLGALMPDLNQRFDKPVNVRVLLQ